MHVMYVAHEISGNIEENKKKILEINRELLLAGIITCLPYYATIHSLDDSNPEERQIGIEANRAVFKKRYIDEVGVFGSRVSSGIFGELELAVANSITVNAYDPRVVVQVAYALRAIEKGINLPKHLLAERKLDDDTTLLFRQDYQDIVLIESPTVIDSGEDVTRFTPNVKKWGEIWGGCSVLNEACQKNGSEIAGKFRNHIFDLIATAYRHTPGDLAMPNQQQLRELQKKFVIEHYS